MNDTTAGCAILLIDESAAMQVRAAGAEHTLAAQTATAVNALFNQMASGPNVPVAVVGYSADGNGQAQIAHRLAGDLVPLQQLIAAPVRVETRIRKLPTGPLMPPREEAVAFPIWYEPGTGTASPQIAAFEFCKQLLAERGASQAMVLHVCAGASSDGSPHKVIGEIQALGDNVVVFHAHLGTSSSVPATLYPSNRAYLPIGNIRDTFDRTSPLPQPLVAHLKQVPMIVNPGARGMIANARLADMIRYLGLVKEHTRSWRVGDAFTMSFVAAESLLAPVQAPIADEPLTVSVESEPTTDSARLLLLLVDRSVNDPFSGDPKSAYARLQERANEMLTKLALKPDPNVHVALTLYGLDVLGLPEIRTGFDGALSGRSIVPAAELAPAALRREEIEEQIPNGVGGLIEVKREKLTFVEVDPTRSCSTLPAFEAVKTVLDTWAAEHPTVTKPPIILHLTRGVHAEDDLREAVKLAGSAAVYHLVATEEPSTSLAYPASPDEIEDAGMKLLADLSSPLGDEWADNPAVKQGARGIVVNGKFDCLI